MQCPMLNVSDGKGSYIIICKNDFNPDVHVLYTGEPIKAAVKKPAKKTKAK